MADLEKDQISIFDILEQEEPKAPAEVWAEEPVQKNTLSFDEFKEHCRHNGWTKPATETEPSHVMCSFNNRQNAKCWEDWIICSLENCPLLK